MFHEYEEFKWILFKVLECKENERSFQLTYQVLKGNINLDTKRCLYLHLIYSFLGPTVENLLILVTIMIMFDNYAGIWND